MIRKTYPLYPRKFNRIDVIGNRDVIIAFSILQSYIDKAVIKLGSYHPSSPGDQLYRCRAKLWWIFCTYSELDTRLVNFARKLMAAHGFYVPKTELF